MAKINDDSILNQLLGMLGGQLVIKRSKSGKRYISNVPEYDPDRKPTPAQAKYNERFKRQAKYGKAASRSPETRKLYATKLLPGCTPYIMAWRDAHYPPVIRNIFTHGYHGRVDDIIYIHAEDDFMVASVQVSIYDSNDQLIEEGESTYQDNDMWIYKVKTNVKGSRIEVRAFDLPKNEASLSVNI